MQTQHDRAEKLIKDGLVKLESETENRRYFRVKNYGIQHDRRSGKWTCECVFASLYSKQEKYCYHVIAAQNYKNNVPDTEKPPAEGVLAGGQEAVSDNREQLNIPAGEIRDDFNPRKDGGNESID